MQLFIMNAFSARLSLVASRVRQFIIFVVDANHPQVGKKIWYAEPRARDIHLPKTRARLILVIPSFVMSSRGGGKMKLSLKHFKRAVKTV